MGQEQQDDREKRLDRIRRMDEQLAQISSRYHTLRCMAEEDGSNTFLALTEAMGSMTIESLKTAGDLMLILWRNVRES